MASAHDTGAGIAAEELLDAVEPEGTWIASVPRSVVHDHGHWHAVFHCLVVRSAAPARVLLQRRKPGARAFPDLLDITVAGHLGAGESPLDGVREIREELGLAVDPARLVPLGRRLFADGSGDGEGRNREIAHVYLLVDDTPLAALDLDPDEVSGFVEIALVDLFRLLTDPSAVASGIVVDTDHAVAQLEVRADELVPALDGYWLVLAVMAERLVAGTGPLAI